MLALGGDVVRQSEFLWGTTSRDEQRGIVFHTHGQADFMAATHRVLDHLLKQRLAMGCF